MSSRRAVWCTVIVSIIFTISPSIMRNSDMNCFHTTSIVCGPIWQCNSVVFGEYDSVKLFMYSGIDSFGVGAFC